MEMLVAGGGLISSRMLRLGIVKISKTSWGTICVFEFVKLLSEFRIVLLYNYVLLPNSYSIV
jgi:hypothetical protein